MYLISCYGGLHPTHEGGRHERGFAGENRARGNEAV